MTYIKVAWATFFTIFIRYVHALTHDPQNLHSKNRYFSAISILLPNTSTWAKVKYISKSDVDKISKFFVFSQTNTKRVSFDIQKNKISYTQWSIQTLNVCKRRLNNINITLNITLPKAWTWGWFWHKHARSRYKLICLASSNSTNRILIKRTFSSFSSTDLQTSC